MQELTKAQQEYFKGSQVKDKDGNLIVCHHITSAEFDEFDKSFIGGHNSFYGKGFYFSTGDKYDETFGEKFSGCFGDIRLECYLDIKNPLVLGDLDVFEVEEIMEYMRDSHPDYGKEDGPYEIAVAPNEWPKSEEEFKLTPMHWNMEIFKLGAWAAYGQQITDYAKEHGYDGIIQIPLWANQPSEIIVFEPNQIKMTTNLYPTKSNNFKDNSREYLNEHLADVDECCKVSKYISDMEKQNKGKQVRENSKNDKEER